MAGPWAFTGEPPTGAATAGLTLIDGATFCTSDPSGDLTGGTDGLYVLDRRVLSRLELRIDGHATEPLGTTVDEPFAATVFGRCRGPNDDADDTLTVLRRRTLLDGLHEEIQVTSYRRAPHRVSIELIVDADFASLFDVKEGHADRAPTVVATWAAARGRFTVANEDPGPLHVTIDLAPPTDHHDPRLTWDAELVPRTPWRLTIDVAPSRLAEPAGRPRVRDRDQLRAAVERTLRRRGPTPTVESDDPAFDATIDRSLEDLSSLRLVDPSHPDAPVVAAGAPWFMTLFGRDAAIAAWAAIAVDPLLACGVAETLARLQGRRHDPERDEQPGKILHELRFDDATSPSFEAADRYYGSVDATPLFVMLVAELRRWGVDRTTIDGLLPAVDRALAWIDEHGDPDGDGFVEYRRATDRGLANQGWKDSWDAIRYADGTIATAPIALCEVQGYVYAAHLGRAELAAEVGDDDRRRHHEAAARQLKERFNDAFWLPERGWFAVGLDGDGRPIDSLTSNLGHCLMTGIVDDAKAGAVAAALLGDDLCSGWGVRTLATSMGGYSPVAYHCGSVWPHDTTIAAVGLRRYGFGELANRLIAGLLAAAGSFDGRLPEVFSGLARDQLGVPAAYPTSCMPQAWAAASPLLWLRTIIGLDPDLARRRLWIDPKLPAHLHHLRVEGIGLAGGWVSVEVEGDHVQIDGLPDGVDVLRGRRPAGGLADGA